MSNLAKNLRQMREKILWNPQLKVEIEDGREAP